MITRETIYDWKDRLAELAAGLKQLDEFRTLKKRMCGDPPDKFPTRHPLLRDYLALYKKVLKTLRKLAGIVGGLHEYEFNIDELVQILINLQPAQTTGQVVRKRTKY